MSHQKSRYIPLSVFACMRACVYAYVPDDMSGLRGRTEIRNVEANLSAYTVKTAILM